MRDDDSRGDGVTTASAPDGSDHADAGAPVPAAGEPALPRRRGGRLPWIVAAVSLAVAIAAVVVAIVTVSGADDRIGRIDEVEQVAGEFALALTTWDASDGMADTREGLREVGTPTFASDVDQLFGGTDDLATLEELGARSAGEVRDVLVQSIEDDTAVALAVVIQRVTTDVTEGEEVSLRYARLELRHDGGRWLVDQVELVVDALQEAAQRTDATELPGFGEGAEPDATTEDAP